MKKEEIKLGNYCNVCLCNPCNCEIDFPIIDSCINCHYYKDSPFPSITTKLCTFWDYMLSIPNPNEFICKHYIKPK